MQSRRSQEPAKKATVPFGPVLREFRKKAGLTQEELAFQSGLHPTYIGQLERGVKSPSLRTMIGLANVMKMKAWELVERVEQVLAERNRSELPSVAPSRKHS